MRFLLDTCALLWLVGDPSRLSPNTRADLARHRDSIFVSAFTALEIAIKHEKRRLTLPSAPAVWFPTALTAFGLQEVPVTSDIALRAPLVTLPQGDPADRVIVATALLRSRHSSRVPTSRLSVDELRSVRLGEVELAVRSAGPVFQATAR